MEIIAAVLGALIAAPLTWIISRRAEYRAHRYELTQRFAAELYSATFLPHRTAVQKLRSLVGAGEVTLTHVANGFWYPGVGSYYEGETLLGFNLHEHLTLYLGWLVRAGYAIDAGIVDVAGLKVQLGPALIWHARFIDDLLNEIDHQTASHQIETVGWIEIVRRAQSNLVGTIPMNRPELPPGTAQQKDTL